MEVAVGVGDGGRWNGCGVILWKGNYFSFEIQGMEPRPSGWTYREKISDNDQEPFWFYQRGEEATLRGRSSQWI